MRSTQARSGRWSDATRASGLACVSRAASARRGLIQIRSRANNGRREGQVGRWGVDGKCRCSQHVGLQFLQYANGPFGIEPTISADPGMGVVGGEPQMHRGIGWAGTQMPGRAPG